MILKIYFSKLEQSKDYFFMETYNINAAYMT